VMPPTLCL